MTRALSIIILLLSAASVWSHATEPTLQDQYLNIFLQFNEAEHLEKDGQIRHALTLYSKSLQQLILVGYADPDLLISLKDIDHRLSAMRTKVLSQPSPLPMDTPNNGFIDDLTADLRGWRKIQGDHPAYESKLVAKSISDDESILEYARKH